MHQIGYIYKIWTISCNIKHLKGQTVSSGVVVKIISF